MANSFFPQWDFFYGTEEVFFNELGIASEEQTWAKIFGQTLASGTNLGKKNILSKKGCECTNFGMAYTRPWQHVVREHFLGSL